MAGATTVRVVLTHGHSDHAAAATALSGLLGCEVWGPAGLEAVTRPLADGERVPTDAGDLVAVSTPGHTRDHLAFHWPCRRALFAGDLLLGRGDTTWVAEYPGCVGDYLASLDRVAALDLEVIYPAHGPPLEDPGTALRRFREHRTARIRQVAQALEADPDAEPEDLLEVVYGPRIPADLRRAAVRSLAALAEYVRGGL